MLQVTYHNLQAIMQHLHLTRGGAGGAQAAAAAPVGGYGAPAAAPPVAGGYGGGAPGLNVVQQEVSGSLVHMCLSSYVTGS